MSTATTVGPARPMDAAMAVLGSGVPLSLLFDLAYGPHSEELLRRERPRFLTRAPGERVHLAEVLTEAAAAVPVLPQQRAAAPSAQKAP